MSYLVDTKVINPWGICIGEPTFKYNYNFIFRADVDDPITGGRSNYQFQIDINTPVSDYVRRVYNLPDDTYVDVDAIRRTVSEFGGVTYPRSWGFINREDGRLRTAEAFSTEAEALEYVDTLGNPDPIITIPHYGDEPEPILFTAYWEQEIDGIMVFRSADLRYTGDQVILYTINDLVNFLASFFGVTPEEVPVQYTGPELGEPSLDCETYLKATIVEVDGPSSPIEIDIDFTGGSIPGDVTVTVVDGDPPLTELENGAGSVTISDAGNINMRNDGGTFFLNEFGNVGFYASGDASLTAESQVQLGSGGTTFNVDSNGLNMRDSTGTVSFTADELSRLKELLD